MSRTAEGSEFSSDTKIETSDFNSESDMYMIPRRFSPDEGCEGLEIFQRYEMARFFRNLDEAEEGDGLDFYHKEFVMRRRKRFLECFRDRERYSGYDQTDAEIEERIYLHCHFRDREEFRALGWLSLDALHANAFFPEKRLRSSERVCHSQYVVPKKEVPRYATCSASQGALRLTDLAIDVTVEILRFLDMKDMAVLDRAMVNRNGRMAFLAAINLGKLCFEGSRGTFLLCSDWEGLVNMLSSACLRWLAIRGFGVRYMSVKVDVPSSLAFAVAKISPNLKCLHMNYDDDNNMYMEQLESFCPELEEVMLRNTNIEPYVRRGQVAVRLVRYDDDGHHAAYNIFCERARSKRNDWRRDPSQAKRFNWKRLMFTQALFRATCRNYTEIAKRLIKSEDCNVIAQNHIGETALMNSVLKCNIELVTLLLQRDASNIDAQCVATDVNTALSNCSHWSALMIACQHTFGIDGVASIALVEILIRNGANLDLKDTLGRTAFDILDATKLADSEKSRLKDVPRLLRHEMASRRLATL